MKFSILRGPDNQERPSTGVVQAITQALQEKTLLISKIHTQITSDVEKGVLSAETINLLALARDNFDASLINLKQNNYPEAVYLFSRGCWNLGEFMGRSSIERSVTPPPANP